MVGLRRSDRARSERTVAESSFLAVGMLHDAGEHGLFDAPSAGGSGTFRMATWYIVDGKGGRLAQAAAGLAQMGVDIAVLQKTKFVD